VEKKRVGIFINPALWDEFRASVRDKYGFTRGVLSVEVEMAISEYLKNELGPYVTTYLPQRVAGEREEDAHTQKKLTKNEELLNSFKNEFNSDLEIERKELQAFIVREHEVTDQRSIKSRINYLISQNVIEEINPKIYKNMVIEPKNTNQTIEQNYNLVRRYIKDNVNGGKIHQGDFKDLPLNIQNALSTLPLDQYNEFVSRGE
jgi:hypothetical protein